MVLTSPLRVSVSLTREPGAIIPILRASSRESLIAAPSTAVITSPAATPAFAAGLSVCGSATSAPSAFLRLRLSAISAVTGWTCTAQPGPIDITALLELGHDHLCGFGGDIESDTDRTTRRRENGGIHADDTAFHVEGRSARIAFIDRRIDLDVVVVWTGPDIAAARR